MARWLIRTYTSDIGAKPVDEWMESLEPAAQAEVFLAVRLLREHGVSLGMPFARHLREGLWELRVRDPAGIYRIVYFHWKGRTFGFVHAFSKKTRATPPADIELGLRRKRQWLQRSRQRKENHDG